MDEFRPRRIGAVDMEGIRQRVVFISNYCKSACKRIEMYEGEGKGVLEPIQEIFHEIFIMLLLILWLIRSMFGKEYKSLFDKETWIRILNVP